MKALHAPCSVDAMIGICMMNPGINDVPLFVALVDYFLPVHISKILALNEESLFPQEKPRRRYPKNLHIPISTIISFSLKKEDTKLGAR